MDDRPTTFLRECQLFLVSPRVRQFLLQPSTRYAVSWFVAVLALAVCLYFSWTAFDSWETDPGQRRRDGNGGHATIDFGGQWLMGRMLQQGHGRQLYNRNVQREVLRAAYPLEDEAPASTKSDAEKLMTWMMGSDSAAAAQTAAALLTPLSAADGPQAAALLAAGRQEWTPERVAEAATKRVGGPLYPPINAFLNYPMAHLPPRVAYHAHQVFSLLLAFVAGLAVRHLSAGRVWLPVAVAAVAVYPGYFPSMQLGQNAALTLTILLWGWALIARGRPGWGGVVWGLLAFKPVWAAAFFLVPLLTRRWTVCLAMGATGIIQVLATLPFVGVESWLDWLAVGRDAAVLYNTDENWIFLSRDLLSIPRRWLLDFRPDAPQREPNWLAPFVIGWGLVLFVLEVTARLAVLRPYQARAVVGPAPAFLLLGAWMCCFHFMYYDALLTALPVFLLFTEAREYLERRYVVILPLPDWRIGHGLDAYYEPRLSAEHPPPVPFLQPGYGSVWVVNRAVPTLLVMLLLTTYLFPLLRISHHFGTPWDTFVLMGLWLWCGWLWLWGGKSV